MSTTPGLILILTIGVLAASGVYLILERSLSRIAIGVIILGNAVNLFLLAVGGPPGRAPIVGETAPADMSDPLPQAMVLTAIVITLALTSFVLTMAYRSWQLNEHDEVQDDLEDRRIARLSALAVERESAEGDAMTLDEEAAETHDETELYIEEHWLAGDEDEQ